MINRAKKEEKSFGSKQTEQLLKLVFACLQSNLIKNTVMLNRKRMLNLRALSEEKSIVVEMCRKKATE